MNQELLNNLHPVLDFLDGLDPGAANAAAKLNQKFPIDGETMKAIAILFESGVSEKHLCTRKGGPGVTYSRVAKDLGTSKFSIDAVRMDGTGPGHTHPNGEFDLCFSVDGAPTFDENTPGWTVYEPGSWHVPTVSGGTMNILYFLPGGAMKFGPKPNASL